MSKSLKSLLAIILIILSLSLSSCNSAVSGLKSYVDATQGYEFLYPNGWIYVDIGGVRKGVKVVFQDLIEKTENLSVVASEVSQDKTLKDLGTPTEVGYSLLKSAIAPDGSKRQADLVGAEIKDAPTQTYYTLEYEVKLPDGRERHNLASVAISRGQLFTFNVSVPETHWGRLEKRLEAVVDSFTVY
ncbi:MAG: photosystem II reaction center PsbP [Spirulinaceae cyanobacterium]